MYLIILMNIPIIISHYCMLCLCTIISVSFSVSVNVSDNIRNL